MPKHDKPCERIDALCVANSVPSLNELYAAYVSDSHDESLFEAITRKAVRVLRDEDEAQEFVIGVWKALPTLEHGEQFSAWLRKRLNWHKADMHRREARACETPVSQLSMADEEGEQMPNEDRLGMLAYRYWIQGPRDLNRDAMAIENPFIRKVAGLLQSGYTQAETADILGVNPATLRTRLKVFRENDAEVKQKARALAFR